MHILQKLLRPNRFKPEPKPQEPEEIDRFDSKITEDIAAWSERIRLKYKNKNLSKYEYSIIDKEIEFIEERAKGIRKFIERHRFYRS